jgi:hypothetical protein
VVAQAWDAWRADNPDLLAAWVDNQWRGPLSTRWILVHLVEEYARHNGHADLLRERIDGRVGQ